MREKCITTEYGSVYYWLSDTWNNEKETIFFFPGLTADHTMFESQVDYFGAKYNLIVWDAPCHGKSRPYEKFDLKDSTEVIIKIMKENKVENMICVGQSFGGYHIQALIARYPEKVKAFVGIGTSPYGEKYYSKSDIFWLKQV